MASLTGNTISSTYEGLLKFADNVGVNSTSKNITDGDGTATPLFVSTTDLTVSGSFIVSGSTTVLGSLIATSSLATTSSYSVSSSLAVSSSFTVSASYATNALTLNSTASGLFAITGSNTFTGSQVISGSLRMSQSSSFTLPTLQPTSPVAGTAFFSGSHLYIYNGSAFVSASFS